MKTLILFLSFGLLNLSTQSQLICRYAWENNPLTISDAGVNAISVSSVSSSSKGGVNGTRGINPGPGNINIDLVLPGSSFNIPAIDIAVDFRREETQASFFYRGTYFDFGINNGKLQVMFTVYDASGGSTNIQSGNIFDVPDDHSFHNYRFHYDNNTGIAKVYADGSTVYTYNGISGMSLYWKGAGNVTVGKDMDATGKNITILDNFVVQNPSLAAVLPCTLLVFNTEAKNKVAFINWNTTKEIYVIGFTIERSSTGLEFIAVKTFKNAGGYDVINRYQYTDSFPGNGINYYRLKMLTADGKYSYSDVRIINFSSVRGRSESSSYPNPSVDEVTLRLSNAQSGQYRYTISSLSGQPVQTSALQLGNGAQQIKIDLTKINLKGIFLIELRNLQANTTETFKIVRQ